MEKNRELQSKIKEWLEWDKNEKNRGEIENLQEKGDEAALSKLLLSRLEFGTAGLRGRMGAGYAQMNDLVIIQTSQGLASYLSSSNPNAKEKGVVIGYDGRHNSKRFAELATVAFLSEGIPVYLYSQLCPTPFVPFAVSLNGCVAGVMVTASHNPKDDNGYKVYWDNGAQIIPPHDKNIQASILQHLCPREGAWNVSGLREKSDVHDPLSQVMESYYARIKEGVLDTSTNIACSTKFAYTAMHGVGHRYMVEAFNVADFKSALDLALRTADREGCSIILANDPDADRLAVAEQGPGGEWHVFSGNELGSLLGWWALHCYRANHPDADPSNLYMLASTVSSKILRSMSRKEAEGKEVLFAYEEAIGFMWGTAVLDKDGVSAAVRVAELVAYLEKNGQTLMQKLNDIYSEYGYHISCNSYFLCYEPPVIKKLFDKLRTINGSPNSYPTSLLGGKYKVTGVRDLTTGFDSNEADGKAKLPVSRSSQMVTFNFDNGLVATLRTSGTEPKIKYYTELCAPPEQKDKEALHRVLQEMVDAIVSEFLQPEVYGLLPRKP
ncbi:hypothetical protein B566_EDAN007532 [Ephemera danica]|nr:hypothetical protein B566_EDAN007532 [Ephemera danica]